MNRITGVFLSALDLLIDNPDDKYCGADIMRILSLPSGTVYPLLKRMVELGLLERTVEKITSYEVGRPAKYFYQITTFGLDEGKKICAKYTTNKR